MKRTPVQVMGNCDMSGNVVACNAVLYTVPAGKRLVIQYASMEAALPVGQTARMSIQILIGGGHFTHVGSNGSGSATFAISGYQRDK